MVQITDRRPNLLPVSFPVPEAAAPVREPSPLGLPDAERSDFQRVAPRAARRPSSAPGLVGDPARAEGLRSELRERVAGQPSADRRRADRRRPDPAVERAERRLERAGFDPGRVDGRFDARTARALERFQAATGAPATGRLDERTQDELSSVNRRIQGSHRALIGPGQHDARTLRAERRLAKLGYDPGAIDGTYDRQTGAAMREFRHDEGLKKGSLLMGRRTEGLLRDASHDLGHDPRRVRVKPSHERRLADRRVARAAAVEHDDGTRGLGMGSSPGRAIKTVQQHLKAAGYDPSRLDGRFDERTQGALEAFQRRSELPVTGRVDPTTWRALRGTTMEARDGFSPTQREGERSAAVLRSERSLKKLGYDPGKVDGLYTPATQRAVDAYRRRHHLGSEGAGIGRRVHNSMTRALEAQHDRQGRSLGRRLAREGREAALSMGGYDSQGLCATGVSKAIRSAMGLTVWGNGNQIDDNLPRSHFRRVNMSLAEALKTPGLILTWEQTSTTLGRKYGHTAITLGDGHSSASDFIESNTLRGSAGRTGLKIFRAIR